MLIKPEGDFKIQKADLATERERQLTTARASQTTGLTNGTAANWAPQVEFSPYLAPHAGVFRGARISSLPTNEIRAPLKTPAWETSPYRELSRRQMTFLFCC